MAYSGRVALLSIIAAIYGIGTPPIMTQAAPMTRTMRSFSAVRVCVPFNVLITPAASANQYQVVLDADAPVQQSLQATVANNVLSLGVSGDFQTNNPIKLTVQ